MYEYCCGECIHWVKCCKCNMMKFQCLKACQFRKVYMYKYYCGECIYTGSNVVSVT